MSCSDDGESRPRKRETYLGDGAYAEYDGFQFRLWAPRENGTHEVFLEPDALQTFLAFVKEATGQ